MFYRDFKRKVEKSGVLRSPPDPEEIGYYPRIFARCALPHCDPAASDPDRRVWVRRCGREQLHLYCVRYENGRVGFPFGHTVRLVLARVGREVLFGGGETLILERAGALGWMGKGAQRGAGSGAAAVREQFIRLMLAPMVITSGSGEKLRQRFASPGVETVLEGWRCREALKAEVELNPVFAREVREHAVPVDMRVLRIFGRACLAIDLYVFATWRVGGLSKPLVLSYEQLAGQFGAAYAISETGKVSRMFRKRLRDALEMVKAVYPQLEMNPGKKGLMLEPGPRHVRERRSPRRGKG